MKLYEVTATVIFRQWAETAADALEASHQTIVLLEEYSKGYQGYKNMEFAEVMPAKRATESGSAVPK